MKKFLVTALFLAVILAASVVTATPAVFLWTYPPYQTGYVALVLDGTPVYANYTGWYDVTGFHNPSNVDYAAGISGAIHMHNDFFEFTIPDGTYTSAYLSIYNPSADGVHQGYCCSGSAVYSNWDVTTSIADLIAYQTGRTDILNDLGSGIFFGSVVVSAADNNTQVIVNLDPAALASINAAAGGGWAVGGKLDQPVPEPATITLVITGLGALTQRLRRKA